MSWKFWEGQKRERETTTRVIQANPGGLMTIVHEGEVIAPNILDNAKIKATPESNPKFQRKYSMQLTKIAHIEIRMDTSSYFGRSGRGTLTQPNHNYIFFDPKRIADKILDPKLVPLIQQFCEEVFREDARWLAQNTNQFTDEKGRVWHLIEK